MPSPRKFPASAFTGDTKHVECLLEGMPRVVIEYSANLEAEIEPMRLVRAMHEAVLAQPIFEAPGARARRGASISSSPTAIPATPSRP